MNPLMHPLPIMIEHKAGIRHLSLRFHPLKQAFVVRVPKRASKATVEEFIARYHGHMEAYCQKLPPPVPLVYGAVIPVLGNMHRIVPIADKREGEGGIPNLAVFATPARCGAVVRKTLESILRSHIADKVERVLAHPAFAGTAFTPEIALRDTVSRWGSCSVSGKMMFSWRLVFAPAHVVDYVVAHECAHLLHHNHSAAFWAVTVALHPEVKAAQAWLKKHHKTLFSYSVQCSTTVSCSASNNVR
jgi:predicted metal-dependent hydrolase